ncbi:MAG: hypothetical protein ACTHJY_20010 [Rhizobiaceae bacterium]
MTDSDNTTSLSFVTRGDEIAGTWPYLRVGQLAALRNVSHSDTAAGLALKWISAHAETQALCIKQQTLEAGLLNGTVQPHHARERMGDYSVALEAESIAAATEQTFLDLLTETPAQNDRGHYW